MTPTLIYCAAGNKRFADIALLSGYRYGAPATVTSVDVTLFGVYVVYVTRWQQRERAGSETFQSDTKIEVMRWLR